MLSHTAAKEIVDGLGVTPNESLFARAVALHETSYGAGWKAGKGAGSHNMGAITTTSPDSLSFKHEDSKFDPKVGKVVTYTTWFAGDVDDEAGFRRLVRVVLKPNVKAAVAAGDFQAGVQAMYENSYFMGVHSHQTDEGNAANVRDYYTAVGNAVDRIGAETGEQEPVPNEDAWEGDETERPTTGTGGKLLLTVALLGGALWLGSKLLKSSPTATPAEA